MGKVLRKRYRTNWKVSEVIHLMNKNPDLMLGLADEQWFRKWIKKNIHIFNEFVRHAVYLKLNGKRNNYSARAIIHKMRWDTLFEDDDSNFKLTNNSTPYMARLSMQINPLLRGMFRTIGTR